VKQILGGGQVAHWQWYMTALLLYSIRPGIHPKYLRILGKATKYMSEEVWPK
jgi:hypothetical protein